MINYSGILLGIRISLFQTHLDSGILNICGIRRGQTEVIPTQQYQIQPQLLHQ